MAGERAGHGRRMRRMLDAQIAADGGARSGTVTWLAEDGLLLLTGRPLPHGIHLTAHVSLDPHSDPVQLSLTVSSAHTGSDNPHGIGALHVCTYTAATPKAQLRVSTALARLHHSPREQAQDPGSDSVSKGSTVPCTRRSIQARADACPEHEATPPLQFDVAHALYAPGEPPSVMVPFRSWEELERTVIASGSSLRVQLSPIPELEVEWSLALVVQLPTGVTVQLEAQVIRASSTELLIEAWSVPSWARTAMRLAS